MAIRWRLGIPAAAFICAVLLTVPYLIAPVQAQSTQVCADCAAERKALNEKRLELALHEFELKSLDENATKIAMESKGQQAIDELRKIAEQRKKKETQIDAARGAVAKLQGELDACLKKCGTAAGPNVAPKDAPSSHPQPVSQCSACDARALAAMDALLSVLRDEADSAHYRSLILELDKKKAEELEQTKEALAQSEKQRLADEQTFDAKEADLAKCNASCKDKRPMTTPSPAPPEEVGEAECPECEGAVLKLKADLADLRYARLSLERAIARMDELMKRLEGNPPKTAADRNEFDVLNSNSLEAEKRVAKATKDVAADRAALDACNKAHPRASCQPPTGTSTTPGTGTAGGTGGTTGQQKAGDGPKPPAIHHDTPPSPPLFPGEKPIDPADSGGPPKAPAPPRAPVPGGTGMVPGVPGAGHPEPASACEPCDGRAFAAREALGEVLSYENLVAQTRYRIFELKAWLSAPTNQQASSAAIYKQKADELVSAIGGLDSFDKQRVAAQQKLDALMLDLANCNAACKDRHPMTTPSSATAPGASEVVAEAECPDCEGRALELEADLARLRHVRFELERAPVSDDVLSLQNELQTKQREVAAAEKDVADDRAALDACNKAHPRESCPALRPRPPISGIPEPTLPGPGAVQDSFKITNPLPFVEDDDDEDTEEEYFTFAVPVGIDLKTLLADPFFKDKEPWVIRGEHEGYSVTIWGGETPVLTSLFLSGLQKRGVINSLDSYTDVCWHFRQASDPAKSGGAFVPAPGAWVLYTLPSPTPILNPGDRPGDDAPPAVARVGRDGKYNATLAHPNGSVELRVAKGCSEHTTVETTVPAGELKRP